MQDAVLQTVAQHVHDDFAHAPLLLFDGLGGVDDVKPHLLRHAFALTRLALPALRLSQEQLEERVRQRTVALSAEIAERKQAEAELAQARDAALEAHAWLNGDSDPLLDGADPAEGWKELYTPPLSAPKASKWVP